MCLIYFLDMKSCLVRVLGYILELQDDHYYVGVTLNLNQRLSQHFDGQGANWTILHKPVRLLHVEFDVNEEWENLTTLTLMYLLGVNKIRGGVWCREILQKNPIEQEQEQDSDSEDEDDDDEEECINEEYFQHQIEYYAEQLFLLEAEIDALESDL
jgi:hypothetical protein